MWNYWAKCGKIKQNVWVLRSSHRKCSIKIAGLKIFATYTEKHLCRSLFLIKVNKVTGLQACNFIKNRLSTGVNIANFLWTPILKKICERVLLSVSRSDYHSENTSEHCSNLTTQFASKATTFNHFNCLILVYS